MAFMERKLHEFVDTLAAKNVLKIEKEEELLPLKKLITDELEAYYEPLQEEAPTAATVLAAYREVMLEVLSVGKGEEETLELTPSEMRHRIIRGFEKL
ncbi:hypothetical protein, conserved [Angomonas deanei]|uniref:Uncharacterized protein n=1 Tax=Angomonas deanei TaxID=59799 RepID=A0A7G2C5V9_9TRYP|nr:hypothetical protein, conserved [Angomonas deanei]